LATPKELGVYFLLGLALVSLPILGSMSKVSAQQTAFYFHNNSELTFAYPPFQFQNYQIAGIQANSSSSSARVFEAATPIAPTGDGLALPMSSTISVSSQPEVYAAFVAWVTNPFPANVTLDGNVVLHVWMSSSDVLLPWQGSEFFMGIADYNPAGSTRFQLLDDYLSNATIGYNGFAGSPTEYVVSTLRINQHQFQAGSMLMFFVGAGSNKEGYGFTVYFDSPNWASRADIPVDPTLAVAEFSDVGEMLIALFLVPIFGMTMRRRRSENARQRLLRSSILDPIRLAMVFEKSESHHQGPDTHKQQRRH
jgi:hypothetical protein